MKKLLKYIIAIFLIALLAIIVYLAIDLDKNKIDFKKVEIEIEQNENNFALVSNIEELAKALESENIHIIELKNDIDLGYKLVEKAGIESKYIQKHNEPLIHPTLKQTGISNLMLKNKDGLIIYSKEGYKILHTNIVIENSKNIKIENIKMEEMWEWDEETKAEYDVNDWDYISIISSENVQIKSCEFSKSYDEITSIKNSKNITIEYCRVNEINIDEDEFFKKQFDELESNIDKYPMYKYLRKDVGLNQQRIKELASYQFKLYLIGPTDYGEKNENVVIHDSMFFNVKTRIPLARNSSVYLYNIYYDCHKINYSLVTKEETKKIKNKYPKIVALGTCGPISIQRSYVKVENCIFKDVKYKYTFWRGLSLKNLGKIEIKQDEEVLKNLKEDLESKLRNQIYLNV